MAVHLEDVDVVRQPVEEFHRRIKTQTVLPCAETVPMLLWALLASGQSPCARSTDGKPWTNRSNP